MTDDHPLTRTELSAALAQIRADGEATTFEGTRLHEVCLELERQGLIVALSEDRSLGVLSVAWAIIRQAMPVTIDHEPMPPGAGEFGIKGILEHPDGTMTVQWE